MIVNCDVPTFFCNYLIVISGWFVWTNTITKKCECPAMEPIYPRFSLGQRQERQRRSFCVRPMTSTATRWSAHPRRLCVVKRCSSHTHAPAAARWGGSLHSLENFATRCAPRQLALPSLPTRCSSFQVFGRQRGQGLDGPCGQLRAYHNNSQLSLSSTASWNGNNFFKILKSMLIGSVKMFLLLFSVSNFIKITSKFKN